MVSDCGSSDGGGAWLSGINSVKEAGPSEAPPSGAATTTVVSTTLLGLTVGGAGGIGCDSL